MRKFAMTTIAAATLLVGGLTGCGVDNQAGDMGGAAFRGAGAGTGHPTTEHRGMTGARYTGEGPITDMFTRDDRTGRAGATGYGVEQRRGAPIHGGQLGVQDRHGFGLDNRGMDRTAPQAAGRNDTGLFGGRGLAGDQTGTRDGLFGTRGATPGGLFGTRDGAVTGQRGGMTGATGITGQRGGMTGAAGITGQHGGMTGAAGITGNRPGMVDDQGILRGQRAGQRGFGAQDRTDSARHFTGVGRTDRNAGLGTTGTRAGTDHTARVQEVKRIVERNGEASASHVVVHGDAVLIGIEARGQDAQALQNKIKQQVQQEVQGMDVYVVTDRNLVNQIRTMDERVQNGGAMEEIGATFTEMTRDLGRAVQRPFERTR